MRRSVLAAFALTFTLVSPAHAALDAWSFGDQPGGAVAALAVSGQNALAAPASNAGGLFRSADGGATWQLLGGLGYRRVSSVAIDPAAGQPWYAATTTGLFRSLDHGDTWEVVATPLGTTASWSLVAVDRGTPGTAYIGSGTQIYRTTTGGSGTWTSVSTSAPSGGFDDILVDPVTHTAWGRRYGAGIYYVSSSGTAWT